MKINYKLNPIKERKLILKNVDNSNNLCYFFFIKREPLDREPHMVPPNRERQSRT